MKTEIIESTQSNYKHRNGDVVLYRCGCNMLFANLPSYLDHSYWCSKSRDLPAKVPVKSTPVLMPRRASHQQFRTGFFTELAERGFIPQSEIDARYGSHEELAERLGSYVGRDIPENQKFWRRHINDVAGYCPTKEMLKKYGVRHKPATT
jgi:hypothetical protein